MNDHAQQPGYQFAGWYIDEARTKRLNPGGILPGIITIYDKWTPVWYPVVYELNGGENDPKNPVLINIESPELPLYPAVRPGKHFDGWYWKGRKIDRIPQGLHEKVILTARFRDAYTVFFHSRGGSAVSPMATLDQNRLPELPQPVRPGYVFTGWFLDAACTKPVPVPGRVNRDAQLFAGWSPATFTIEYDVNGGMNSRRNPRTYSYYDPDLPLLPARKTGAVFEDWFDQNGKPVRTIPHHSRGNLKLTARYH